jgi:hypothetical protein
VEGPDGIIKARNGTGQRNTLKANPLGKETHKRTNHGSCIKMVLAPFSASKVCGFYKEQQDTSKPAKGKGETKKEKGEENQQ